MPKKKIKLSGVYKEMETIQMDNGKVLKWSKLTVGNDDPLIPFGTKIKITLAYDPADSINGSNGIVWATYSQLQVETINDALLVQNVFSEIRISNLENKNLYLIFIENPKEIEKAIDFIWRDEAGLKLKLDWYYPINKENESFNKWLSNT